MTVAAERDAALYQQDTDLAILLDLFERIETRIAVDVGAEKGAFVDAFLEHGCEGVLAFEPFPAHATWLRNKYRDDARVSVFELALGASDASATLNIAQDKQGNDLDYFHTLQTFADLDSLRWSKHINVECRSLASMAATGQLPYRLGVLKIDTEGNDLQVLRGLGDIVSDVVVVEFWDGLEDSLGRCPYTLAEIARELRGRKYRNFAAIKRHDEFEFVQLNSDMTRPGDWGNAIFVHDNAFERLGSVLFEAAATAGVRLIDQALRFRTECAARLEVIEALQQNLGPASPSGGGEIEYDLPLLQRLNSHGADITPLRDRAELHKGDWPDNGVFVGRGWYPLEHFDGATFRWVDREAEIVISRPTVAGLEVHIDLEIGPGAGREPLEVRVLTQAGGPIVGGDLVGRKVLTVRLPTTPGAAVDVFRLTATGGGYATRDDPRRLNFRVFSVTPAPSPEV